MSQFRDSYIQIVSRIIRFVAGAIAALAIILLIIGFMDCIFKLDWGWDCNHLWILIIIFMLSLVIYWVTGLIRAMLSGPHRNL